MHRFPKASPVHPIMIPIALRASRIQNTVKGIRVAVADLLIGIVVLELGVLPSQPLACPVICTSGSETDWYGRSME